MNTKAKTQKIASYVLYLMGQGMGRKEAVANVAQGLGIKEATVLYAVGQTFGEPVK